MTENAGTLQYPHCDPRVLHAPSTCEVCDEQPERQQYRMEHNIAFTGETEYLKKLHGDAIQPCPAEAARGLETINAWSGNRPVLNADGLAKSEATYEQLFDKGAAEAFAESFGEPEPSLPPPRSVWATFRDWWNR